MHFHDPHNRRRDFNPLKVIPWVLLGIVGAAALALVFGLVVMALWNWLMPELFGLTTISYWQAWGLVLLAHILFKSGGHGRGHSDRDRREEWKRRFHERYERNSSAETPGDGDIPQAE